MPIISDNLVHVVDFISLIKNPVYIEMVQVPAGGLVTNLIIF